MQPRERKRAVVAISARCFMSDFFLRSLMTFCHSWCAMRVVCVQVADRCCFRAVVQVLVAVSDSSSKRSAQG